MRTISVFKDAAALLKYGSRAPFGVILVTLKSRTDKTTINYNNSFRINCAVNLPEMMDSYTFANYFNAAARNSHWEIIHQSVMQQMLDFQAAGGTNKGGWKQMARYGENQLVTRLPLLMQH